LPPPALRSGVISGIGSGQCSFTWFTRGLPIVKKTFAQVWGTDDLIVSFDGLGIVRPPDFDKNWQLNPGLWYHVDQNGRNKFGKICVQGQVNYFDSGDDDGGLVVIPRSIHVFSKIFENRPELGIGKSDFIALSKIQNVWNSELDKLQPIKVCVKAGDLTLWDSRTVHCNAGAKPVGFKPDFQKGESWNLRRAVSYVCMTPRSRLTPENAQLRKQAIELGLTTTHWPEACEVHPNDKDGVPKNFHPPILSQQQMSLV